MVCVRFLMMRYLSNMFFRYYFINQQPWIRLFCCYKWYKRNFPIPPLQNHNFALYWKRNSNVENCVNDVYRKALPIEVILKAIYNQSITKSAVVPLRRQVHKGFSCCLPLQNLIFASNST